MSGDGFSKLAQTRKDFQYNHRNLQNHHGNHIAWDGDICGGYARHEQFDGLCAKLAPRYRNLCELYDARRYKDLCSALFHAMQGLDLIKLTSIGAILRKKVYDLHLRSKLLVSSLTLVLASSLALVLACIVRDLHVLQGREHILVQDVLQS